MDHLIISVPFQPKNVSEVVIARPSLNFKTSVPEVSIGLDANSARDGLRWSPVGDRISTAYPYKARSTPTVTLFQNY